MEKNNLLIYYKKMYCLDLKLAVFFIQKIKQHNNNSNDYAKYKKKKN